MPPPDPSLHAIVLCDRAIQESGTNKYVLIGTFTEVRAPEYPVALPELAIYTCFAGARGDYNVNLQFVNLEENEIIGELKGVRFSNDDPLRIVEVVVSIHGIVFPKSGKYEFRFLMNDRLIGHKPLWARVIPGGR